MRLFEEITLLNYAGSLNLLYRYITQGRVEADRPAISPRRFTRHLLTAPGQVKDHQQEFVNTLTAACPEMTSLVGLVRCFAASPFSPQLPAFITSDCAPGCAFE